VFVLGKVCPVYCLGICICLGFLFAVCPQLLSGCVAMCSPMRGPGIGVNGIAVG
jgi:hypothetical protein